MWLTRYLRVMEVLRASRSGLPDRSRARPTSRALLPATGSGRRSALAATRISLSSARTASARRSDTIECAQEKRTHWMRSREGGRSEAASARPDAGARGVHGESNGPTTDDEAHTNEPTRRTGGHTQSGPLAGDCRHDEEPDCRHSQSSLAFIEEGRDRPDGVTY